MQRNTGHRYTNYRTEWLAIRNSRPSTSGLSTGSCHVTNFYRISGSEETTIAISARSRTQWCISCTSVPGSKSFGLMLQNGSTGKRMFSLISRPGPSSLESPPQHIRQRSSILWYFSQNFTSTGKNSTTRANSPSSNSSNNYDSAYRLKSTSRGWKARKVSSNSGNGSMMRWDKARTDMN